MKTIKGEAKLTFTEATSIIVGHGVGSGILSVPYLASRNSWRDILWLIVVCYCINLIMHLMIAELSYNNNGAQFIKCIEAELFKGRVKQIVTWVAFAFLGLSVIANVVGFITGGGAVLTAWLGLPGWAAMLIYYAVAATVVLFGMKLVGICEKISVFAMVAVMAVLFVATLINEHTGFANKFVAPSNLVALYSMIAFSLSAVMSVPQVVKGLEGDTKKIRASIACGTGINVGLILLITFMTLFACGSEVTGNGALVDLSGKLGGWVGVIGFIFSLLALSTSFWANTLNLRDIINEQTKWGTRASYLVSSLPCLAIALLGFSNFVGFTRIASVIQVLTGIGIICAYHNSRKRASGSEICGRFGGLAFQVIVCVSSVLATVGALAKVL
jgi:amino acid permease